MEDRGGWDGMEWDGMDGRRRGGGVAFGGGVSAARGNDAARKMSWLKVKVYGCLVGSRRRSVGREAGTQSKFLDKDICFTAPWSGTTGRGRMIRSRIGQTEGRRMDGCPSVRPID